MILHVATYSKQDRKFTYKRNIHTCSRNHCYHVKSKRYYTMSDYVTLDIQHAVRTRNIILSSVACPALSSFSTLSDTRRDFRKNICIYRVSRGECATLRQNVPYVKVHRSNPKHLYPKLNGYGDNGERKAWSSCGSTYCTCFACCYPYTAHVRPSVSQPSQAHSAFVINRRHSYSEL